MDSMPQWRLVGDWFDVCSCDIPCPCEFAQPPTNNHCEGVLAWRVRDGTYGDVPLAGLNVLAVGAFDGNIWTGEATVSMGFFIDERADPRQRTALQAIFGGKAGGWPAGFAALVGDVRGMGFAPITVEIAGDLARWRAEIPGQVTAMAQALSGPTTPPGKRVQTLNPPGSEVGPGGVATWGSGDVTEPAPVFGLQTNFVGKSSKHIPFDWSGPGSN